jgi:hypothetical protein
LLARNSFELSDLLDIRSFSYSEDKPVISGSPQQNESEPRTPQQATENEGRESDPVAPAVPDLSAQNKPSPKNAEQSCGCRYEPTPRWIRILEAAGIVSAIVYAIITGLMWRDSHHNFIVDERCWLSINAGFPADIKEEVPIVGTIAVKNTGKTAGLALVSEWNVSIVPSQEPVKFIYSGLHATGTSGIIYPNGVDFFEDAKRSPETKVIERLTKAQVDDLLGGKTYAAMYGRGTYRDIFGKVYWFHYCAWHDFLEGRRYPGGTSCTEYNEIGDGPLPDKPETTK